MAKRFDKSVLIVFCLLVIMGIVFAKDTARDFKPITDIIIITDQRTEHLRDRIMELEKKVEKMENKASTLK